MFCQCFQSKTVVQLWRSKTFQVTFLVCGWGFGSQELNIALKVI